MTRRLALAILFAVWAMLIAAGMTAYLTTREVLLSDLDQTLVSQASALRELIPPGEHPTAAPSARAAAGSALGSSVTANKDRYVIRAVADGRVIPAMQPPPSTAPAEKEAGLAASRVVSARFSTLADGSRVRTVTLQAMARPLQPGGQPIPVQVTYSRSADSFDRLLTRLAWMLACCGLAGGLFAALIATRVSRMALRPLRDTADVIGSIDERNLDRRIEADALPPELQPMARRLNEMLDRLQQAFGQRRQFLADAAHELRTPVAALITGMEVTLARPRQADAYRNALQGALADATQLRRLVERLMEQVKSENFSHNEPAVSVDVSALLDECSDVAAALGQARNITVRRSYQPGISLQTQHGRLRSIVGNVLSNAVEYNRDGGTVEVMAECNGHGLELTIRDDGPGIASEKLPHLFEPFFRGDDSHRSDTGHLGLGLFLVKTHLDTLNGRCTVESEPGSGSRFQITIPERES